MTLAVSDFQIKEELERKNLNIMKNSSPVSQSVIGQSEDVNYVITKE